MRAALAIVLALAPALALAEPVTLEVALVDDPDLPALDDTLVGRAMASASETFATQFGVEAPKFAIVARFSLDSFMKKYAKAASPECAPLFAVRYKGGGKEELMKQQDAAIKFFQRWPLEELKTFIPAEQRAAITDVKALHAAYMDKYLGTVALLQQQTTPAMKETSGEPASGEATIVPGRVATVRAKTPLLDKLPVEGRSHAAWTCALAAQRQFDVIVTNTFILADILTEPHPHAVFGKAKVGGIAAPSPGRKALGGQALVASTFSIDTPIPMLSELGAKKDANREPASGEPTIVPGREATVKAKPVTVEERASILGAFLLAHEVAHAVFGIPDVFDHPPGCLMTTRPGESYRDALTVLLAHPGPCPRCRPWVEARAAFDSGKQKLAAGDAQNAVTALTGALKAMPAHFHGKKKRVAAIVTLAAQGYEQLGDTAKAKRYAALALESDPTSEDARAIVDRRAPKIENVGSKRSIKTSTSAARATSR